MGVSNGVAPGVAVLVFPTEICGGGKVGSPVGGSIVVGKIVGVLVGCAAGGTSG